MRYDHFNPVVLNEFALQKVRDGDVRSALILLERANLLAPHDARIRRNLDMLRAQRDGKPFLDTAAVDTSLAQEKSESDATATLAKQDSSMEQLPVAPIWRKPGQ
jgi:Flp pilus assembly protein TadD